MSKIASFDFIWFLISFQKSFNVDFQQGEQGFSFLKRKFPVENPKAMNHLKMLTMVSMETKVVSRDSFLVKLSENFTCMDSGKGNMAFARGGGGECGGMCSPQEVLDHKKGWLG